jgi:hypothetical protein
MEAHAAKDTFIGDLDLGDQGRFRRRAIQWLRVESDDRSGACQFVRVPSREDLAFPTIESGIGVAFDSALKSVSAKHWIFAMIEIAP